MIRYIAKRQPGTKLESGLVRTNFVITREQYLKLKRLQMARGNSLSFWVQKALERYLAER